MTTSNHNRSHARMNIYEVKDGVLYYTSANFFVDTRRRHPRVYSRRLTPDVEEVLRRKKKILGNWVHALNDVEFRAINRWVMRQDNELTFPAGDERFIAFHGDIKGFNY